MSTTNESDTLQSFFKVSKKEEQLVEDVLIFIDEELKRRDDYQDRKLWGEFLQWEVDSLTDLWQIAK